MVTRRTRRAPGGGVRAIGFALLAGSVVAMAGGCVASGRLDRAAFSPERFVAEARIQAPDLAAEDLVVPFQVTADMVATAREIVFGARTDYDKAQRLMASITDADGFGLVYDAVATSTPAVTVERGHGNCLALTSIFIGLARQLGLSAYYVDASDRVNALRRQEALIVDSGHIAGGVRTERGYTLIDFDGHVSDYRTFKIIDDITALAHFYNNRGFEMISDAQRRGDEVPWGEIRHNFELATKVRPAFVLAYNNLGVAYTRLDEDLLAEAAYRRAIEVDPKADAAYHNLGNLLVRRGEVEAALISYDRAVQINGRNPYLHYHRGTAQYRLGELTAAENSFKKAISLEREYIEPRNLLAQVYFLQGRLEEAAEVREATRRVIAEKRRE